MSEEINKKLLEALKIAGRWLHTAHDQGLISGEEFATDIQQIDLAIKNPDELDHKNSK